MKDRDTRRSTGWGSGWQPPPKADLPVTATPSPSPQETGNTEKSKPETVKPKIGWHNEDLDD